MSSTDYPDRQTRVAIETCVDRLPREPSGGDVVFGFDGFVDTVRLIGPSANGDAGKRIESLGEFGQEIVNSDDDDSSLAFHWEKDGRRTGGHVSHLSRAYARLGFDPTLVGTCGDPVLDLFREDFADCTIHSLGEPSYTDAVEFHDGKILLQDGGDLAGLDWETVEARVGVDTLAAELDGARLLGIGYWSVIPALGEVMDGLRERVFPKLSAPPEHVLVDPADIRGLDPAKLREIAAATCRLADVVDVTLSANRSETKVLAAELAGTTGDSIDDDASAVFDALAVDRVVGHSMTRSVAVSEDGPSGVAVEPVESPELVTSAGDHFNTGLSLGLVEGLPDAAAVVLGNALAREFVRTGEPPSYPDVVSAVSAYGDQFE